MEYVNLGNSGLKVSRVCLGAMSYGSSSWRPWILNEEEARPFFKRALELGINFFDTADIYSLGVSEEITGRALKDFAKRDEVVIATKVYAALKDTPNAKGLSRVHIMKAVDDSLRRLGTDYIDLYQIHRWDYTTPIEETLEALHDIVKSGKVRYIGASSMFAWQFSKALYLADINGWTRFISMQNHYNLIYREEEREMNPLCNDQGVGLIPWSPLARGFLCRKHDRTNKPQTARAKTDDYAQQLYYQDSDYDILERVLTLADKRGVTPAQISLAWLLHKKGVVSPIIGATKLKHLEEAVQATEIELTEEEMTFLEEPYQPHPILGHS